MLMQKRAMNAPSLGSAHCREYSMIMLEICRKPTRIDEVFVNVPLDVDISATVPRKRGTSRRCRRNRKNTHKSVLKPHYSKLTSIFAQSERMGIGGTTSNRLAYVARESMMPGYKTTPSASAERLRARPCCPGKRTASTPGIGGVSRQVFASQPVSRQNASEPPNAAGSVTCTYTEAPQPLGAFDRPNPPNPCVRASTMSASP